jgi:alkanesulfonate monooxygenase SsuD/methylene tetrahydromethanopterin reductase-like flavin-dependent oxidoreductase (luciferase family)
VRDLISESRSLRGRVAISRRCFVAGSGARGAVALFDGLLPIAPDADQWARLWNEVKEIACTTGRDPNALTGAMYMTVITDEDRSRANERLNAYLEQYYGQPAAVMRSRQACYAGPNGGLAEWLQGYAQAGTSHLVLRFAGDHERHLETVAALRIKLAS